MDNPTRPGSIPFSRPMTANNEANSTIKLPIVSNLTLSQRFAIILG